MTCDNCGAIRREQQKGDNPFSPIKIQTEFQSNWKFLATNIVPEVPWLEKRDYNFCSNACFEDWRQKQATRWHEEVGSKQQDD